MTDIYELASQYRALVLADADEDLTDLLDSLEGDIEDRVDALAAVARTIEAHAKAAKAEIARMQDRARALENRAKRVRRHMLGVLQVSGLRRVKSPRFTVSLSAGRSRVVVDDVARLPAWAVDERVVREARKDAIARALKAAREDGEVAEGVLLDHRGEPDIPGVHVEHGDETLTIR